MMVIPAIIPNSKEHLLLIAGRLVGSAPALQLDLIDGKYVGIPSWPWVEGNDFSDVLSAIKELSISFEVEVDFMVQQPERYALDCIRAGARRVVVHVGSTDKLNEILKLRGKTKIGLAFQNATPLDALHAHREHIDFVQCMGIDDLGIQGDGFDPHVLPRIREIRSLYPNMEISVDGHVTMFTLPLLKDAGATRFVSGSAIVKAEDPALAYKELQKLADV